MTRRATASRCWRALEWRAWAPALAQLELSRQPFLFAAVFFRKLLFRVPVSSRLCKSAGEGVVFYLSRRNRNQSVRGRAPNGYGGTSPPLQPPIGFWQVYCVMLIAPPIDTTALQKKHLPDLGTTRISTSELLSGDFSLGVRSASICFPAGTVPAARLTTKKQPLVRSSQRERPPKRTHSRPRYDISRVEDP